MYVGTSVCLYVYMYVCIYVGMDISAGDMRFCCATITSFVGSGCFESYMERVCSSASHDKSLLIISTTGRSPDDTACHVYAAPSLVVEWRHAAEGVKPSALHVLVSAGHHTSGDYIRVCTSASHTSLLLLKSYIVLSQMCTAPSKGMHIYTVTSIFK